ncbi:hypothetical protein KQ705_15540, partial [Listeria monocytogenes]|nr:hypothetical protein [Listeria monocytogenes]
HRDRLRDRPGRLQDRTDPEVFLNGPGYRFQQSVTKNPGSWPGFFVPSQAARIDQDSVRPLFAAMRMRSALSLMKPAASAWL